MSEERYEITVTVGPGCSFRDADELASKLTSVALAETRVLLDVTVEELVPHDADRRVLLEELARAAVGLDRDEQLRHEPTCADVCGEPRWSGRPVSGCQCGLTRFLSAREALR